MKRLNKLTIGLLMAAVLLGATAQPGHALVLTLGLGNTGIAAYPSPFGTVEITRLTGTTATIKFISNVGPIGGYRYAFGDGSMAAFNLAGGYSAASVSITSYTAFDGGTPGPFSDGGSGQVDGWGNFNRTYNDFDGFTHAVRDVTFSLTKTSGSWATDNDILTANADGYRVAAHVFIANADFTNTGVTGYATEGMPEVPEPMTVVTLGSGLLAMAGLQFRRRRKV